MSLLSKKQWLQVGIGGLLLTFFLLWHPINQPPVHAQLDTSTSFRLSRIETDIRNLQSEIQSLETALNRAQRSSGDRIIVQEVVPDVGLDMGQDDAIDPLDLEAAQAELMFDQLATLVIETRQDMFALQEKVETLEQTINK